jgi:murein DD-endopeptidase MepM/ murein hydrolase activator NlpD
LREQNVSFTSRAIHASRQLLAAVSLAVSLVLSLSPVVSAPVAAAPPESAQAAASDVTRELPTGTDTPLTDETSQLRDNQDQLFANIAPKDDVKGGDGSVRLRGLEAPVQLEQKDAKGGDPQQEDEGGKSPGTQAKEAPDPGDGPVRKQQEAALKRPREREPSGIRIWPMPAKSYTFTQQFGCVPQLGNLYFPGEGCPADRPVIHTGIDLAAPEGTPFYAAASGWITLADYDRPTADANTRIIIQHDGRNEGYATDYLHWVASYVEEGDYVHAGDPIGEVGNVVFSTGPHLHFSVTDLSTGEFIDPLRWLPDEPGLEGYVSDVPHAQMRLPAGTTAGQPESADPVPHSPPVKEKVPESASSSSDGNEEKSGEGKREDRHEKAPNESAANDGKRSGKKASRPNTASETNTDESQSDVKNGGNGSPDGEPSPERKKDKSPSTEAAGGDDSGSREKQSESSKADRRENREPSKDAGGTDEEEPKQEHSERPDQDDGRHDSPGHDEPGGRDERPPDRRTPDQGKPDEGSNDGNHDHRKS